MHCAPADFAFGGEPLAVSLGNGARLAKCVCNSHRVCGWIFGPGCGAHGGVNAYNSVLTNAEVSKLLADGAGFTNLGEKGAAFFLGSHGGPSADRRPNRRDQRAGYEVVRSQFFRE